MHSQIPPEAVQEHERLERKVKATRYAGYTRLVIGVAIAVIISYMVTSYLLRDNQIAACKRNNTFKRNVVTFVHEASAARAKSGNFQVAAQYAQEAKVINGTIVDCQKAFPSPIP